VDVAHGGGGGIGVKRHTPAEQRRSHVHDVGLSQGSSSLLTHDPVHRCVELAPGIDDT
jgi:hypothetical protein